MGIKAKLRAWLIDLVREAIRIEFPMPPIVPDYERPTRAVTALGNATNPKPIVIEPSFEQMQADALKAQEKYYEPERA